MGQQQRRVPGAVLIVRDARTVTKDGARPMALAGDAMPGGLGAAESQGALVRFVGAIDVAFQALEIAEQLERGSRRLRRSPVRLENPQSVLALADGLAVCIVRASLAGRLQAVLDRTRPHLALQVVPGQGLVELGEALGVQILDDLTSAAVQRAAVLLEQALVRHVVRERVLEQIGQLGERALLVDELHGAELAERLPGVLR